MLNLPIHHIGVACKSIKDEMPTWETLGFVSEAKFIDETQGIKGEFIVCKNANNPLRFELLENLYDNGVLDSYLANKTKMYHIAYESKNIESDTHSLLETPIPANYTIETMGGGDE